MINEKPWRMPVNSTDVEKHLPFSEDVSILKTHIQINNKTVHNRFVYQPMEGCDGTLEGKPDELTKRRYDRFAKGGAGIIWFEATAVMQSGRANPRQMYINENTLSDFKKIVDNIKEVCVKENGFEPIVICQLTHSGRYSKPNGYPEPLIAYNNPVFEKDNALSPSCILSDIALDEICDKLVNGALLAQKAGFDGADIKSCHRYLLSELLSAYTRDGKYGGSFENRTRMLTNAIKGALAVCDESFIITSRFNAYDGFAYPYGFASEKIGTNPSYEEAIRLSLKLKELGIQMLNITMGNPYVNSEVNRPTVMGDADPLQATKRLLKGAKIINEATESSFVVSSGLSYLGSIAPNVAAGCIENGYFSFAGFGRETLAYPNLARDIIRNGEFDKKQICITCGKCTELMRSGRTPGCVIRDKEVYLPLYHELENERKA